MEPSESDDEIQSELARFAEPIRTVLLSFDAGETDADEFGEAFTLRFSTIRGVPSRAVATALDRLFFSVQDHRDPDFPDDPSRVLGVEQLRTRVREFIDLAGYQ